LLFNHGSLRLSLQRATLESTLTRSWARRGLLARALWPLSLLFRALVGLRRGLYGLGLLQSVRLAVPVIVVGNIFVGGTGKTPLTIWLVEALRAAGYCPGVISRGYGASDSVPRAVTVSSSPQQVGDEPLLIASRARCPVMVGRDRVATGRALLAAFPEVDIIVSDDGLQHYALARDVEIVLSDARGAGNGWLLPAGPLREPLSGRRDFPGPHGASPVAPSTPASRHKPIRMELNGGFAERMADRSQRVALAALPAASGAGPAARIVAAAGIGNPARFFAMLRGAGLVFDEMPLPDHFDFKLDPFAAVAADIILITEKDAVKCVQIDQLKNDLRLWVVPVTASIDGTLAEQIVEKCRGCTFA
jgi:tetraacyldisaccharide 4'-kinase